MEASRSLSMNAMRAGLTETFDRDAGIPAAEHGLVNEYYLNKTFGQKP